MKTRYSHLVFHKLDTVNNPNSIHGIYPYRGKISALDAENIIKQFDENAVLLDPFCGSGTILYEAQKHNLKTIGVDSNPLAITLSNAKITTMDENDRKTEIKHAIEIINKAKTDLKNNDYTDMPKEPKKSFHIDSASEIMSIKKYYEEMSDFLKAAYFGAIALTARGCNHYKWTSSTVGKNIEPKRYIDFYDKFLQKVRKHIVFTNGKDKLEGGAILADSRHIDKYIKEKSVDIVFCSPPYFDALDYTAYYGKLIYEIHEKDRSLIRQNLIQTASTYEEDMREVLLLIDKVTKDNSLIVFVVGDRKRGKKIINGGQFFAEIWEPSYILERKYVGSSSQVFDKLNKTKRKEQIVVWEKINGEVVKYDKEFHTK